MTGHRSVPLPPRENGGRDYWRLRSFATAIRPLYLTYFTIGPRETRTVHAIVDGTTSLGPTNAAMPPGIYHFDWDGQKVEFRVTLANAVELDPALSLTSRS